MIQIVWEFIVKESAIGRFLRAYGPDGAWSRLFQEFPGFLGTTLLRDQENPRRFLTIDVWETGSHRKRMLTQAKGRYSDLDEILADLTESEDEIGVFNTLTDVSARARPSAALPKARKVRSAGRRTKDDGADGLKTAVQRKDRANLA
jgi:hypothetical protein